MRTLFRVFLLLLFLAMAAGFNVGLIDVRLDEMRYLIGRITVDEDATQTFGMVAKYEIIKRRMLYGDDDMKNFELEAKVAALASEDPLAQDKEARKRTFYQVPVRAVLNVIRFCLGKEIINPVEDNQIVHVLEIGYFWERNRKYPDAIKIYDQILAMSNLTPDIKSAVMAHKAFCHSMLSEYGTAKDIYERVINAYPTTEAGILSWKLLDFIQSMEKERASLEERRLSDFEKAKQFFMLMDYRNAIKFLSIFLQQNPPDSVVCQAEFYKGRSHEELGETNEAVAEYSKVIRNDKGRMWAKQANRRMIMLGEFYENKKQMADEARRQLAEYHDSNFMDKLEQFTKLVSESSLRKELLDGTSTTKQQKSAASDSLLKIINQIGYLDLAGEKRKEQQAELEKVQNELLAQGKLSRAEIQELSRVRTLKENAGRRPVAIKHVIDDAANQFRYLYNRRLRAGAKLAGKMQVEIKINPAGVVTGARTIGSTIGDPDFEQSVLKCVTALKFAPVPDSLGDLTVNYPFEFTEEE